MFIFVGALTTTYLKPPWAMQTCPTIPPTDDGQVPPVHTAQPSPCDSCAYGNERRGVYVVIWSNQFLGQGQTWRWVLEKSKVIIITTMCTVFVWMNVFLDKGKNVTSKKLGVICRKSGWFAPNSRQLPNFQSGLPTSFFSLRNRQVLFLGNKCVVNHPEKKKKQQLNSIDFYNQIFCWSDLETGVLSNFHALDFSIEFSF